MNRPQEFKTMTTDDQIRQRIVGTYYGRNVWRVSP